MLRLLFLLLAFNTSLTAWGSCPLKDGDLVFIKSQSAQSALLKLTTESEWTHVGMIFKNQAGWDVIEAVQPVQWTSLYSFIRRSRHYHFEVYRAAFDFEAAKVKAYAEKQLGQNYDLIFAMDDERWYCSELVWKAYEKSAQEKIGELQKVGDLKVSDPRVLAEAKSRFNGYGMTFNAEQWFSSEVITPVQMMKSEKVEKVLDHKRISSLKDCLLH
jgi:hypothetical protein